MCVYVYVLGNTKLSWKIYLDSRKLKGKMTMRNGRNAMEYRRAYDYVYIWTEDYGDQR